MKKILILLATGLVYVLLPTNVFGNSSADSTLIIKQHIRKKILLRTRGIQHNIEAWKGGQEIRFRINEATETLEVWVRDAHAQVVIRRQFYGNETLSNSIDISPLPSGEYTLHFYPGDMPETEYSGKFYKKEEE